MKANRHDIVVGKIKYEPGSTFFYLLLIVFGGVFILLGIAVAIASVLKNPETIVIALIPVFICYVILVFSAMKKLGNYALKNVRTMGKKQQPKAELFMFALLVVWYPVLYVIESQFITSFLIFFEYLVVDTFGILILYWLLRIYLKRKKKI